MPECHGDLVVKQTSLISEAIGDSVSKRMQTETVASSDCRFDANASQIISPKPRRLRPAVSSLPVRYVWEQRIGMVCGVCGPGLPVTLPTRKQSVRTEVQGP